MRSKELLEAIQQENNENLDQLYREEKAGFNEEEKFMGSVIQEAVDLGIDVSGRTLGEIARAIAKIKWEDDGGDDFGYDQIAQDPTNW